MERFDCEGWLHITASESLSYMDIKLKHLDTHPAYVEIGLSDNYKKYIEDNVNDMTPGEVRTHRLTDFPL
jgi:hypothetical protein